MDLQEHLGSHLKFRHLLVALAVDEYGSLGRTAEHLYMTQPALSRMLREAETAIGAVLFERTRNGMVATESGVAYLEHARSIVGQSEVLRRRIKEIEHPGSGSVSIGVFVTGANLLVPRAVAALAQEYPDSEIRIIEAPPENLIQELNAGTVDVLVGRITSHSSTAQLQLVSLYRESYRIVARKGHECLDANVTTLEQLVKYPWAMPIAGTPLYDTLVQEFALAGVPIPQHHVECATPAPLRTLILEAGYLSIMQESMAVADEEFEFHPLRIGELAQDVGYMLSPNRPLTKMTRLLINSLEAQSEKIRAQLSPQ
ncbi:LysR substrate-binding domain-containing protein [Glutamicibacter sp.]|uniref:LysR substrate-binding domain-containing protein n=1 Tax=Glutamicibacter sp. TaxID=1931995 RepID=UPI002FE42088